MGLDAVEAAAQIDFYYTGQVRREREKDIEREREGG